MSLCAAPDSAAEAEAAELLQSAKNESTAEAEHQNEIIEEMREEMFKRVEKDHQRLTQKNEELEEKIEDRQANAQEIHAMREQLLRRKESAMQSRRTKLSREETRASGVRTKLLEKKNEYLQMLRTHSRVEQAQLKDQAREQLEQEAKHAGTRAPARKLSKPLKFMLSGKLAES